MLSKINKLCHFLRPDGAITMYRRCNYFVGMLKGTRNITQYINTHLKYQLGYMMYCGIIKEDFLFSVMSVINELPHHLNWFNSKL